MGDYLYYGRLSRPGSPNRWRERKWKANATKTKDGVKSVLHPKNLCSLLFLASRKALGLILSKTTSNVPALQQNILPPGNTGLQPFIGGIVLGSLSSSLR